MVCWQTHSLTAASVSIHTASANCKLPSCSRFQSPPACLPFLRCAAVHISRYLSYQQHHSAAPQPTALLHLAGASMADNLIKHRFWPVTAISDADTHGSHAVPRLAAKLPLTQIAQLAHMHKSTAQILGIHALQLERMPRYVAASNTRTDADRAAGSTTKQVVASSPPYTIPTSP